MKNLSSVLLCSTIRHAWIAVACFSGTSGLYAQTTAEAEPNTVTALPSAERLHEQYLAALGGRKKLEQQVSSHATGKLKFPEMGVEADIFVVVKAPNQLAIEFEVPGAGRVCKATNGELAWEINPFMGTRLIDGKEKEQFMKEADLHAELHHDKYYSSMQTLSQIDLDGRPCYKVKLVTKNEEEEIRYYDAETHFLVRNEQTAVTPLGQLDIAINVGDYREVAGIMVPFELSQEVMGSKQVFAFDSIEINSEIDDARFAVPDEIKELIDRD